MAEKTIKIDHLYRVEGHGGIRVEVDGRNVLDVKMDIFEGSRFFEALIRGRNYSDVPMIMCRICAICSSSHRVVAIKAVENAIGLQVTRQTRLLRELLILGEIIESHSLHLFCLAAPDFLGLPGVAAMAEKDEATVRMGLGLKKAGNEIQEAVGGRRIHQLNAEVGGFSKAPEAERLKGIRKMLEEKIPDGKKSVEFMNGLTREVLADSPRTFSALKCGDGYGYSGDTILVSTGDEFPVEDYRKVCNERVVTHSHAKHSLYKGEPFMTGSLARLYFSRDRLKGEAAGMMKGLDFSPGNILWNNIAQAVEIVQSLERGIEIIDELLGNGYREDEEPVKAVVRAGKGTAATEAPRGTLYHSYEIDDNGLVVDADVITPTAINLANMEKDIRAAAEANIDNPEDSLKLKLEKVARAYDPCISCAVHLVDIRKTAAQKI